MAMASTFDSERNGMLGWWCLENGLAVLVGVSGDVGKQANRLTVRVALDTNPVMPSSEWMVQRQGGFTLAYLRPDLIERFTKAAQESKEARIQVWNASNNSSQTYRFAINGLASARARLNCDSS